MVEAAAALATTRAPERSVAQRVAALREANRIRVVRARMKREVKTGERTALSMLIEPDCATMHVIVWLQTIPLVGQVRAARILRDAHISAHKTLGGLTERQRAELGAWLG